MNGKTIGIPRYYMKIIDIPEDTRQRLADESIERNIDKLKKEIINYEELVNGDNISQKEFLKKLEKLRIQRRLNILAKDRLYSRKK